MAVATVIVSPDTATISGGLNLVLTATLRDAAGHVLSGRTVTWSCSDSTLAGLITNGQQATLVPQKPGQVVVLATSEGKSGTARLNIAPLPIARLQISPMEPVVAVGQTSQLSVTATDIRGNEAGIGNVTWRSSDEGIATVSSAGVVRGIAAGIARIRAAVDTVTASVTVIAFVRATSGHLIGIRTVNGVPQFFNRYTGARFTARGNNYISLALQTHVSGGLTNTHSMFQVGLYDPTKVEAALGQMSDLGYNVVRVFLETTTVASLTDTTTGLSAGYTANVADFLRRAKAHGIVTLLTGDWPPFSHPYSDLEGAGYPTFDNKNLLYMGMGGVQVYTRFWPDFIALLVAQGAPLDDIFAYELASEYYFESRLSPLNLTSGLVRAANGHTYDMSDTADKQRMMTESIAYFADRVRGAILGADPTALVGIGQFWPTTPNPSRPGDTRVVLPVTALLGTTIDFIDLHPYQGLGLTVNQMMQNFGVVPPNPKPVIMAEFGAMLRTYYNEEAALQGLQAWQKESCTYGLSGWMLWDWDVTYMPDGLGFWTATAGSGAIGRGLSPAIRPDPCS
jgi:hypothetical protein